MKADLILKNGKIYSPLPDGRVIRGSAVAVKDGIILEVANDDNVLVSMTGDDTEVIDCGGNTILPGLCDAHCHPSWSASFYVGCPLFAVQAAPEETSQDAIDKYISVMEPYIANNPENAIYRGLGWNRAFFNGACRESKWPTRHDLDRICSDKPVILESYCQHAIWVNTRAIEMAGLSADTPDPSSGIMMREEDGYPSGIFMEFEPMDLIKEGIEGYDFTVDQYKDALRKYQQLDANCYGVTMANDCYCTENAMKAYKELAESGELTMRFRGVYKIDTCSDEEIESINAGKGMDNVNDLFEVNTIKIFAEGNLAMLEPYEPEHLKAVGLPEGYTGDTIWPDEVFFPAIEKCMRTGLQIHIHAMGDKAVRQSVRGLAAGQEKTGIKNRNTIAHVMAIDDDDLKIMGESGIIASLQPRWMVYDADMEDNYFSMFGEKRSLEMYANKKFSDAGCIVAYGTDFPVTPPPNPYHGIQCAITRSVFDDGTPQYEKFKGTIQGPKDDPSKECVDLKSAVISNSYNGAYQMFLENTAGSIEKGKSADLVVLDRDIESIPVTDIHKIKAEKTIFKGNIVYSR